MNFFVDLFKNKIFLAPAAAWLIAQLLKIIIDTVKYGFKTERLYGEGGMPSAHAAMMSALVVITGLVYGGKSFEFVMALACGVIVAYDARGVRFETQRQGRALNNLNEERVEKGKQPLDIIKFKEKIGHTLSELIVGSLIGVCSGIIVHFLPI